MSKNGSDNRSSLLNAGQHHDLPIAKQAVMADSPEVMKLYYADRVLELEMSLAELTLQNHPKEIAAICAEICSIKKELGKIAPGKNGGNQ